MKTRLTFVCLAAATFLLRADSAVTTKTRGAETRVVANSRSHVSTKRFVPVSEPLDERNEERAPPLLKKVLGRKNYFNAMMLNEDAYSALTNGKAMKLMESYHSLDDLIKFIDRLMEKFTMRGFTAALLRARMTVHSDFASMLFDLQIESFRRKRYTPAQVFKMLNIRLDSDLLLDPFMDVLEHFVARYRSGETLVSAMSSVDERVLLESIAVAKALDNFRDRGLSVEMALIRKWISNNESPRNLLGQLGISPDVEILQNPCLATVMKYIRQYNNISPSNKFSLMRWLLQGNNDHYALVEALILAERNKVLEKPVIEMLQNELLEIWFRDEKKSIDAVFKLLRLKNDGFHVGTSPKLELMKKYISLFTNDVYQRNQQFLTVAQENLDDGPLAILVWTETEKENDPAIQEMLDDFFDHLIEQWTRDGIDPWRKFFSKIDADLEPTVEAIVGYYNGNVFHIRTPRRS